MIAAGQSHETLVDSGVAMLVVFRSAVSEEKEGVRVGRTHGQGESSGIFALIFGDFKFFFWDIHQAAPLPRRGHPSQEIRLESALVILSGHGLLSIHNSVRPRVPALANDAVLGLAITASGWAVEMVQQRANQTP